MGDAARVIMSNAVINEILGKNLIQQTVIAPSSNYSSLYLLRLTL